MSLLCQIRREADPFAVENRREHRHVRRVRAAAQIRMVGDEGVALVYFVSIVVFQNSRGAGGKGAHVQRQHHMLRDHFALAV
jgi:hypothetical protein